MHPYLFRKLYRCPYCAEPSGGRLDTYECGTARQEDRNSIYLDNDRLVASRLIRFSDDPDDNSPCHHLLAAIGTVRWDGRRYVAETDSDDDWSWSFRFAYLAPEIRRMERTLAPFWLAEFDNVLRLAGEFPEEFPHRVSSVDRVWEDNEIDLPRLSTYHADARFLLFSNPDAFYFGVERGLRRIIKKQRRRSKA